MAGALSFVGFGGERCGRRPLSPDYSPLSAAPSSRATSPEYKSVSLLWMLRTPEHAPSTTLRLGPSTPPPLRRAASPDYEPPLTYRVGSPEYTPVSRAWRSAGSPDYTPSDPPRRAASSPDYAPPSTPTYGVASPEYTPVSREWRAAAGSPDYTPSDPPRRAASPDYEPPLTYRVESPEYTPVSRAWGAAGSPDYTPSDPPRRAAFPDDAPSSLMSPPRSAAAASPDYTPLTLPARAPPPSPLVSDTESRTSPPRRSCRRHHPYQRSGARQLRLERQWDQPSRGQRHVVF